ncbi:hypothetical protein [Pseudomonas sp.]|uniref:hypothetical protein n=1 Tax=Pseudomonas sp. TaxID=306 RepID=UPI003CC617FB
MSTTKVFEYAQKMTDAMIVLRDSGHTVPALMLTYAAIDQMAWLAAPQERTTNADFKNWVSTYMLTKNTMNVTVDELWEARNGLLHTGTAESSANQRDTSIRKVFYTVGAVKNTVNNDPAVVFVNAGDFFGRFLNAVMWFTSAMESDPALLANALAKLDRMLIERGLDKAYSSAGEQISSPGSF